MPQTHRALDWLARRHAGESAAYVAHHAGVSEKTVLHATRAYGPFPRPSTQLGRTTVSDDHLDEGARRWVDERRRGYAVRVRWRAGGECVGCPSPTLPRLVAARWLEGLEASRARGAAPKEPVRLTPPAAAHPSWAGDDALAR